MLYKMKAADYCVSSRKSVIMLTYFRGPLTSLTWGPVGHCTSGRPLNPPLSQQLPSCPVPKAGNAPVVTGCVSTQCSHWLWLTDLHMDWAFGILGGLFVESLV